MITYLTKRKLKNKAVIRSLLVFACILAPLLKLRAQDSLEVDSFVIVKEFVPVLSQASKIRVDPEISDTDYVEPELSYTFLDRRLPNNFTPEPIKAASLKGEPLVKLYRNYLILGYGNNTTPLAEFYYNQLRSKKTGLGVYGKHLSSSGLHNIENSNYSNNTLGLSGNYYSDKLTYSSGVNYSYDHINYYGFNLQSPGISVSRAEKNENVWQYYSRFNAGFSVGNNQRDTVGIRHFTSASFSNLKNRNETSESRLVLSENFSISRRREIYTLDFGLDYNNEEGQQDSLVGDIFGSNMIMFLEPGIELKASKWKLEGSVRLAADFNDESEFFFYPILDFSYNLVKNIIIPYAGMKGQLSRNSYTSLSTDNPFVSPALTLKNSNEVFTGYAGIKGNLSKNTSFNAELSQSDIRNLPLYIKDTNSLEMRSFSVIYDDVTRTVLSAELSYEPVEKWRFLLNGKYYIYDTGAQRYAWHKPDYRISLLTSYNLADKIRADLTANLIGSQRARIYNNALTREDQAFTTLDGTVDLNLHLEYRYSRKISVFLKFNNLASIHYEKWQDYPTQAFNFIGGFKFSF